jgi:hypothetical protein
VKESLSLLLTFQVVIRLQPMPSDSHCWYTEPEFIDVRSAGILPAVSGASRSRPARGQDAHVTAGETPTPRKQFITIFCNSQWVLANIVRFPHSLM